MEKPILTMFGFMGKGNLAYHFTLNEDLWINRIYLHQSDSHWLMARLLQQSPAKSAQ